MATTAAINAFKRVYSNPAGTTTETDNDQRLAAYRWLWAYYENSAFSDLALWQQYRANARLYRHTRPIYNPSRRLVDFYTASIYQGAWAMQPEKMTKPGAAMPFEAGTPPQLLTAIAQLWQWSNMQTQKSQAIRYGAALGDVMIAIVDDVARRKVYYDVIWPGFIPEIEIDPAGNVTRYVLEYAATDPAIDNGRTYTYRREVTKETIKTYKDDRPYAFGDSAAEEANPYTFVPAVWIMHSPGATTHGGPAIRNLEKIDELNALIAHAVDQGHRILESPIMVAGENVSIQSQKGKTPTTDTSERESLKIITGATGARIETARLDPGEAIALMEQLTSEIESDHPELTMYAKLREMTTVTGPGADRLFGDVRGLVDEARARYDQQFIKLLQMSTAIAGWRANTGAWGELNRQQSAFLPFSLDSYADGDLDLSIQARPLIPISEEEQIALEGARQSLEADKAYAAQAGAGRPQQIADRLRQADAQQSSSTSTQKGDQNQ